MSDDNKKILGDDEYHFTNEEYTAQVSEDAEHSHNSVEETEFHSDTPGGLSRLRNPKVIAIIMIAIFSLVGFKLYHAYKDSHTVVASTPAPAVVQTVAPQVTADPSPELINQLNVLRQQAQDRNTAVNNLQSQVQNLQSQLQSAADANNQLVQTVNTLNSQMQQLNQKLTDLTKPKVKPKKVVPVRKITYQLVAIVPGRAWINSSEGVAKTVRVGDQLPQYGVVVSIDSNQGIVTTNSGKIIGYGNNDS